MLSAENWRKWREREPPVLFLGGTQRSSKGRKQLPGMWRGLVVVPDSHSPVGVAVMEYLKWLQRDRKVAAGGWCKAAAWIAREARAIQYHHGEVSLDR